MSVQVIAWKNQSFLRNNPKQLAELPPLFCPSLSDFVLLSWAALLYLFAAVIDVWKWYDLRINLSMLLGQTGLSYIWYTPDFVAGFALVSG